VYSQYSSSSIGFLHIPYSSSSHPLIGPEKMEHLVDMLPVLEMTLSDELREACDNLVPPGSSVANFHNTSDWFKGQIL